MSNNVFSVGDVVYHARFGMGQVGGEYRNKYHYVYFEEEGQIDCHIDLLSFKPWPAPCHQRPIADGWWVVSFSNQNYLRKHVKGEMYSQNENGLLKVHIPAPKYKFIKFIGELPE